MFIMLFMELGPAMGGDIGGGGGGTWKDREGSLPETCLWLPWWYIVCGETGSNPLRGGERVYSMTVVDERPTFEVEREGGIVVADLSVYRSSDQVDESHAWDGGSDKKDRQGRGVAASELVVSACSFARRVSGARTSTDDWVTVRTPRSVARGRPSSNLIWDTRPSCDDEAGPCAVVA